MIPIPELLRRGAVDARPFPLVTVNGFWLNLSGLAIPGRIAAFFAVSGQELDPFGSGIHSERSTTTQGWRTPSVPEWRAGA